MTDFASHVPLAFSAGLLSILSPCVMPLMPAYLSLISGISVEDMRHGVGDVQQRRRIMRACAGFVSGFSSVFILLGVGAVAIGQTVRTWRGELFGLEFSLAQIAGVLIVILGLHMTGLTPIRFLYREARPQFEMKSRGFASTFAVGAGFGLGWSPCIGPILSTILTIASARDTMWEGTALLAIYSAGLAVPFLLAGWSIDAFFRTFQRVKHHFHKLEVASGVMLMCVGVLLATDQLSRLNSQFRFMASFINAAEKALQ